MADPDPITTICMKISLTQQKNNTPPLRMIATILALISIILVFFPTKTEAISFKSVFLALATPVFALPNTSEVAQAPTTTFPVADDRDPIRTYTCIATAYSSEVAQTDDTPCIPANGYNLCKHYDEEGVRNTIAINFLPFETKVRLPELFDDKVFVVRDRMNAKYNYDRIGYCRLDVWMPTREEAVQFGVRRVTMEIYGREKPGRKVALAGR